LQSNKAIYNRDILNDSSMKYISSLLILCIFIWSANQVMALSYKDSIQKYSQTNISSRNIQEAKLLETHVVRFTQKIHEQELQYNIASSHKIQSSYRDLLLMKKSLVQIQNGELSSQDAEAIMKSIVLDLKIMNATIKDLFLNLEIKKNENLHIKKTFYNTFTQKYWSGITVFIDKITTLFISKKELSKNEKKIVRKLIELREENKNILIFQDTDFSSEEDMKKYLKNSIENIQKIINEIKSLSR